MRERARLSIADAWHNQRLHGDTVNRVTFDTFEIRKAQSPTGYVIRPGSK